MAERKKIFVSYSHSDRDWLLRLQAHLAVLQRRGAVDLWSDMRIAVGESWREEIESALSSARIAVLLVTPNFLASEYVWDREMPRVMAHRADGMQVLPLIARACAWQLSEELADLQARPVDGRALANGSEAQIDLDLAAFIYELAGIVDAVPPAVNKESWARMIAPSAPMATAPGREGPASPVPAVRPLLLRAWQGRYDATNQGMTLHIEAVTDDTFVGRFEYAEHGAVTEINGTIVRDGATFLDDARWRALGEPSDIGLVFREIRVIRRGRQIDLDGEYLAFVDRDQLRGGWFRGRKLTGRFMFTETTAPAAEI